MITNNNLNYYINLENVFYRKINKYFSYIILQKDLQNNVKAREQLNDKCSTLREQIQSLEAENAQLTELVAISERESKKAANMLDRAQIDNKDLTDKCEKLSKIGTNTFTLLIPTSISDKSKFNFHYY